MSIKSLEVEGGGAERVFVDLANHLVNSGWLVKVITLDYNQKSFYPLDSSIDFHALALNKPGTSTSIISLLKFVVKNRQISKVFKPDIYISFMHSLYIPAQFSMLGSGIPFIASEHFRANYSSSFFQNLLVRFMSHLHFLKTVPSQSVFEDLSPSQRKGAVVLPNPVDQRFFAYSRNTSGAAQAMRIVCVGRLMLEKNHLELFDAINLIKEELQGWVVDLYGDGVDRALLEARVKALGLESIICFKGFSSSLEREYAGAQFSVVPSLYESFGLAAAESLACGCPVLAFDCCLGVRELVTHEQNGLIVPSNENRIDALAQSMLRMIQDVGLRQQVASSAARSVQHFQKDVVMASWSAMLENVCAGNLIES